jgi:hypothetical protein
MGYIIMNILNKKNIITLLILLSIIGVSSAESVYVKYQGNVSLDNFNCTNTISSFVNRVCYEEQDNYVVVLLGSTYYHYCRVPNNTVDNWLDASSKGKFYHAKIKGRFDCRLGGIPK